MKLLANELKKLITKSNNIVITTHRGPDGDAMGSSLALYNLLQKDHNVTVITPNDYASFLNWMPGNANVIEFIGNDRSCFTLVNLSSCAAATISPFRNKAEALS